MKMMAIGAWIRTHVRESMIYLIAGVISLQILFVMKMAFWMKAIVVGLLMFGAYEAIATMHGKKSPMKELQKGMQEAQKGMKMDLPDLSQEMGGFGPFQGQKKRKR